MIPAINTVSRDRGKCNYKRDSSQCQFINKSQILPRHSQTTLLAFAFNPSALLDWSRVRFPVLSAIIIAIPGSRPPRVLCMHSVALGVEDPAFEVSLPATVCLRQQPRAYRRNLCLKGSGRSVGGRNRSEASD